MRKLTECETKEVKAGEVICFWATFNTPSVKHDIVYGNKLYRHTDYHLGFVAPKLIGHKYGKF